MNGNGNGAGGGGGGGGGPGGLPKLREILRRQKPDSDDEETPDIEFDYADADYLQAEIAEFYSYTENPEFPQVHKAFEECMDGFGFGRDSSWREMDAAEKTRAVQRMLDQTEVSSRSDRLKATRAILYVAQGCWLECQSDAECLAGARENVLLLYKNGVFGTFVELLNLEME